MYLQELREHPGSVETLLEFGDLLFDLDRLSEAEEKFRRVLEIKPAETEAHRRLGDVMSRQGRFDLSITEYELVRNLEPDGKLVLLELSEALLALKRTREAQRTLLEYVEQHPSDASKEEHLRCADLLIAAGLPGVARDHLNHSLKQFPGDRQLLRRAAFAHFDGGDRRGGDRVSRRVRRLEPGNAQVHENLVLSALKGGNPALAGRRLKRALEACPQSEPLRRLRAYVLVHWVPRLTRGIWQSIFPKH